MTKKGRCHHASVAHGRRPQRMRDNDKDETLPAEDNKVWDRIRYIAWAGLPRLGGAVWHLSTVAVDGWNFHHHFSSITHPPQVPDGRGHWARVATNTDRRAYFLLVEMKWCRHEKMLQSGLTRIKELFFSTYSMSGLLKDFCEIATSSSPGAIRVPFTRERNIKIFVANFSECLMFQCRRVFFLCALRLWCGNIFLPLARIFCT